MTVTLLAGLAILACGEALPSAEAALAARQIGLALGVAALVAAPLRIAVGHLTAHGLRAGDPAAIGPHGATLVGAGVTLGLIAGALAAALTPGAPLEASRWLVGGLCALASGALIAADGLSSGGAREVVVATIWTGCALSAGLLALGARVGGIEGGLLGAQAGLAGLAAALIGRFLGGSRHGVVAMDPRALVRALGRPLAAVAALAGAASWVWVPTLVARVGAADLPSSDATRLGLDLLPSALGQPEIGLAALVIAPALLLLFAREEATVGLAHQALFGALERGAPLDACEASAGEARRVVATSASRVFVAALACAALAGVVAPGLLRDAATLDRLWWALCGFVLLATTLPIAAGLEHLARDGLLLLVNATCPVFALALATIGPMPALGAFAAGALAQLAVALLAYAVASRGAALDLVRRDAAPGASRSPGLPLVPPRLG